MNLIDKDALVAEIERRIQESLYAGGATRGVYLSERMKEDSYILSFLETLEVKEVDLEKEICIFFSKNPISYENITDWPLLKNCAIYFFNLGLKAQQNISIDLTDIDKVFEENGVDPNSKEAKMFKESYYMALERFKARKGE